jgi:hypothetical protein
VNAVHGAATPLDSAHERRIHQRLRQVFDAAMALIDPFFDRDRIWTGVSLEHFAHRVLREHYPELDAMDIYIFVAAARRVYAISGGRRRSGP